jgi:NADH:ubiquinone oxidoreductase subunit 6 (subunit J)
MILEIVGVGLVISACLAIFLDEAVYAVAALAGTFILTALMYALSGAVFVAVFQFAMAIGTVAILFLSGEMLSEKSLNKTKPATSIAVVGLGAVLSLPAIFISISSPNNFTADISFGDALWNLRAFDVVLQGLVILTVALGIAIILYHRKRNSQKRIGEQ